MDKQFIFIFILIMSTNLTEMDTEYLTRKHFKESLNISYNSGINKRFFGIRKPDGNLFNKDNNALLIIECKKDNEREGKNQMLEYCQLVKQNKENKDVVIYCCCTEGTTEETFKIEYFKYDEKLIKTTEQIIKKMFGGVKDVPKLQEIHNDLVLNFKFDNAKELHDILYIIVSSCINDEFKEYYEKCDDMVDKIFNDYLAEHVKNNISDTENTYIKYIDSLKNTQFKNAFKVCKKIYLICKYDPNKLKELFQQFKKYNSYTEGKNEIWTPDIISDLMFNVSLLYTADKQDIILCDPCIGFNALINPFIDYYGPEHLFIKGCEISKRLSIMSKIGLLIKDMPQEQSDIKKY